MNRSEHQNTNAPAAGLLQALPSDPNKAMQQMMDTIDQLRNVYEQETEALGNVDTKSFLALQDDKQRAAEIYKNEVEEALTRKEELRKADPALKRNLEKMQADFSELSHKNMEALKRMQKTMDRLSGTLRGAAKEAVEKQRTFSYNQNGYVQSNKKKRISTGSISETA